MQKTDKATAGWQLFAFKAQTAQAAAQLRKYAAQNRAWYGVNVGGIQLVEGDKIKFERIISKTLAPHFKAQIQNGWGFNRRPKWFDENLQTFFVWINLVPLGGK